MGVWSRAESEQVSQLRHLLITIRRSLPGSLRHSELSLTLSQWITYLSISSPRARSGTIESGKRRLLDSVFPHRHLMVTGYRSLWTLGTTSRSTSMWRTPSSYSTNSDWWVLEPGSRLSSRLPKPIDGSFFLPHLETRGWTTRPYSSRMATSRIAANSFESTSSTRISLSSLASTGTSKLIDWKPIADEFWSRCRLSGIRSGDQAILSSVMMKFSSNKSGLIGGTFTRTDQFETLLRCLRLLAEWSTLTQRDSTAS